MRVLAGQRRIVDADVALLAQVDAHRLQRLPQARQHLVGGEGGIQIDRPVEARQIRAAGVGERQTQAGPQLVIHGGAIKRFGLRQHRVRLARQRGQVRLAQIASIGQLARVPQVRQGLQRELALLFQQRIQTIDHRQRVVVERDPLAVIALAGHQALQLTVRMLDAIDAVEGRDGLDGRDLIGQRRRLPRQDLSREVDAEIAQRAT